MLLILCTILCKWKQHYSFRCDGPECCATYVDVVDRSECSVTVSHSGVVDESGYCVTQPGIGGSECPATCSGVDVCECCVTNSGVVDECRWWVSMPCYVCRCRWWGWMRCWHCYTTVTSTSSWRPCCPPSSPPPFCSPCWSPLRSPCTLWTPRRPPSPH